MDAKFEIERQINDDFQKFYNTEVKDLNVPDDIIFRFKDAVLALPPQAHHVHATKLKVLGSKKVSELTYGDINEIIKILFAAPLELTSKDFDVAILKQIDLEKFVLAFNKVVDDFQEKLKMKQANLTALTSRNGNNNMRIIN